MQWKELSENQEMDKKNLDESTFLEMACFNMFEQ